MAPKVSRHVSQQVSWDQIFGQSTPAQTLARLDMISNLLDNAFTIPGTNRKIGIDALIGLLPVVGDMVAALLGSYLVWEARRLGAPPLIIARMIGNLAFDTVIGAVPFLGDVFDVAFKANRRNFMILKKHLESTGALGVIEGTATRL
jgi:hypothetical protein